MIKRNLKVLYICLWLAIVLQIYSILDTVAIFIGYGLTMGMGFVTLEGILPSLIFYIVIMGLLVGLIIYCHYHNQDDFDPKEAILYVEIFLVVVSVVYLIGSLSGLPSYFMYRTNSSGPVNDRYLYQTSAEVVFRTMGIVVGSLMAGSSQNDTLLAQ